MKAKLEVGDYPVGSGHHHLLACASSALDGAVVFKSRAVDSARAAPAECARGMACGAAVPSV